MKNLARCGWEGTKHAEYIRYHDEEWGVPVHDDRKHFEFLILEGAQAGLSWWTILSRRDGYRRAFAEFDPERVARFTSKQIDRLMSDSGIIRNRQKIQSAVTNARCFLELVEERGSFDDYIWSFVHGRPVDRAHKSLKDLPVSTPESDALSKDLKRRGFKFVGSTIMYAHMQATGLFNDHLVHCFRYRQVKKLA